MTLGVIKMLWPLRWKDAKLQIQEAQLDAATDAVKALGKEISEARDVLVKRANGALVELKHGSKQK